MPRNALKVGQQYKLPGLNMRCEPTVVVATIDSLIDPPRSSEPSPITGEVETYDCIVLSEGIRMYADSRDFV